MKTRIALIITGLIYILACFWLKEVPFFWDFVTVSDVSQQVYSGNFDIKFIDGRHSVLFCFYLATCWSFLGKTLLVSHLALLPFILGIVYEFIKIGNFFKLNKNLILIGLLLVFIDPTISTQIILMGFDVALVYLFLASINAIFQKKNKMLVLYLSFLALFSMRGIMLLPVLLIFNQFINKLNWKQQLLVLIPILLASIHFLIARESILNDSSRQLVNFGQIIRNSIYIVWKMLDFGRVFLLIALVILYRNIPRNLKMLLIILPVSFIISMAPFSNPIGHRYFMVFTILMVFALLVALKSFDLKKQISIFGILAVLLVSGNFWIYPVKYGNGWDSSLKVLNYFEIKDDLDKVFAENNIKKDSVLSGFPLLASNKKTVLTENQDEFADRRIYPIESYKYVAYSNVCNEFTQEEINTLKHKWIQVKSLKKGQVEIFIYQNPK